MGKGGKGKGKLATAAPTMIPIGVLLVSVATTGYVYSESIDSPNRKATY